MVLLCTTRSTLIPTKKVLHLIYCILFYDVILYLYFFPWMQLQTSMLNQLMMNYYMTQTWMKLMKSGSETEMGQYSQVGFEGRIMDW